MSDQKPVSKHRARANTKPTVRRVVRKACQAGASWPKDRIVSRLWGFADDVAKRWTE